MELLRLMKPSPNQQKILDYLRSHPNQWVIVREMQKDLRSTTNKLANIYSFAARLYQLSITGQINEKIERTEIDGLIAYRVHLSFPKRLEK